MNDLVIFNLLPNDIIELIKYHLQAIIIQNIFKLNRPLTKFEVGDRVIIKIKIYGTIIKIYNNICKIKLLPRLIPNWKKCNINFWKSYENLIEGFNFPYYTPKELNINKNNIIKLNPWNYQLIDKIDSKKRIEMYFNNFNLNSLNSLNNSQLFTYYF